MEVFQFKNSKGVIYYLHAVQSGKGGSTIYFFKRTAEGGCPLPAGKQAIETSRGLPVLKSI